MKNNIKIFVKAVAIFFACLVVASLVISFNHWLLATSELLFAVYAVISLVVLFMGILFLVRKVDSRD